MTIAEKIANQLDNNGQCWQTEDKNSFDDLMENNHAFISTRDGYRTIPVRYEFSDGSAIVCYEGGWDIAPEGCEQFCWNGIGCECKGESK